VTGSGPSPDATELRRRFDEAGGFTVGLEEETMLLDPETLDLAPVAVELLKRTGGDARFKLELPASQLEIVTAPAATVPDAIGQLAAARRDLAGAADGLALPAVASVHPFAAPRGVLNGGARYEAIRATYGLVAERQLVSALQVHVAVGGAERTLAVYHAMRCHLPELTALAANGPFYVAEDTGLATVRPLICGLLPRQGVPPRLQSWEMFAQELRWAGVAQSAAGTGSWWWELRPHPSHGTLELRVPDAQTCLAQAAGVVTFVQALVATLAERFDRGEHPPDIRTWRIEENRFSAIRHGLDGEMADLNTGRRVATRCRLTGLLRQVAPVAERLGAGQFIPHIAALIAGNGALAQRHAVRRHGVHGLPQWLNECYLTEPQVG
jgi:glutamate---cysteine ligase / carboxylate-amine ligase